jgi:hypothetical protein
MCLHDLGPCLGPKWMEEPASEGSAGGGKIDEAGARGTVDVHSGMSSSSGMVAAHS